MQRMSISPRSICTTTIFACVCSMLLWHATIIHAQIVINEFDILASPQKVELLNTSTNTVDISGWHLDDSGGTTYSTIPTQTPLPPTACAVITGNFFLNTTTADSIRLFDASAPPTSGQAVLIDTYAYTSFPVSGETFTRIPDGIGAFSLQPNSMGLTNVTRELCSLPSSPTPTPTPLPTIITPTPTTSTNLTPSPSHTPTPILTPTPIENLIIISEVMVNPSTGNEWVELYNNSATEVSLAGWMIDDMALGGSNPILLNSSVPSFGYFVISMPNNIFNNTGDTVRVLDLSANEHATFAYTSSQIDTSWGISSVSSSLYCLQTPSAGMDNYPCLYPTTSPTLTPSQTPTPTVAPDTFANVYLSELYVHTNTGEHEWIELYNDNKFTVSVRNWIIKDATNTIIATLDMDIPGYRYGVIELSSNKMNNAQEKILLMDTSAIVRDTFEYQTSEQGKSWGRSPGNFGTWCLQAPSRYTYNTSCLVNTTPTPTASKTPTPTKSTTTSTSSQAGTKMPHATNLQEHILGTYTDVLQSANTQTINYTPQTVSDSPETSTKTLIPQQSAEPSQRPSARPSLFPIIGYLSIMSICLIIGGFQLAHLWALYQNLPTHYPDNLG